MSYLADMWADQHLPECDYCFAGGDPHKCKRWEEELDRANTRWEFLYDSAREEELDGACQSKVS